ncbi:MAG TPA: DUF1800 domain-containing protein [Actinomycetota bacterium]|nr:DUF1800 domain-containing protein [Actinomycetota bacterium]
MSAPAIAVPDEGLSRRALLGRAAVVGGLVAIAPQLLDPPHAEALTSAVTHDPNLHLLRRATYGPTRTSLKRLKKIGHRAWIEEQLRPTKIHDPMCDHLMASRFPGLKWTIAQANARVPQFQWDLMFDLGVATLARACWSQRQLLEVMVDFWSNHLNVTNPSDSGWNCRHDYDRTVIRAHALGRFVDMLKASAKHPAMLQYLNNAESNKWSPNENYGRELLELHTVGINGGYNETDMRNSALIMTGFTIDWNTTAYHYEPDWHYTGHVKVMKWHSANTKPNGYALANKYLEYLAHHPATARHIAGQLCQHFVSDDPPQKFVNHLANVYLKSGTNITPVLRELFNSPTFAHSIGQKVRRPMEDIVATVRTLDLKPDASGKDAMQGLYYMVDNLGNAPMAWPQPNGYPDEAASWSSAGGMLGRWNAHLSLAAGWWPNLRQPKASAYLPHPLPKTHAKLVQALAKRLVFRELPTAQVNAICTFLGVHPGTALDENSAAVGWRLPYVMALILDAPSHGIR